MSSPIAHIIGHHAIASPGPGVAKQEPQPKPMPATAFFDKTYDEALRLTHEARSFIASGDQARLTDAPLATRLIHARESMRLTARLTQVMAWLFYQKAVHAGEIDRAELAAPDKRLGGRTVCSEHDEAALAVLPPSLQSLMRRSHRLYARVARLDEMVGRDAAPRPGPPPIQF